ncbi:MAG: hypothetical protein HXY28_12615 [Hydrogenophilaceae bacterium]|jgi:hypothetical protein|nr:hypothetical protein [Hydrogenophilaceae bacterium]
MRAFLIACLAVLAPMSAAGQGRAQADTLYLLCRMDDGMEALLLVAPGEFRQNDGGDWGENLCAFQSTTCTMTNAGVLRVSHPEIPSEAPAETITLDTIGGAFRYESGADLVTGRCGQVAEPVPRAP